MKLTAIKFFAFATVATLLMLLLYNTMSNQLSGDSRTYKAEFTSVSGLRSGDDVRAAGVSVGRVQSVGVTDKGAAEIEFILSERQKIYANTSMVVRYQNLLGQRYVALVPGKEGAPTIPGGTTIPLSRTSPGFDLTALLNGFEPLFATIDPKEINRLASSIVSVLQGEGGTIESLLDQTATVSSRLADDDEVVGAVITNLTPVLEDLAARDDEFDETILRLRELTSGLAKERKSIGSAINGVSELSQAAADLVDASRPDLDADITRLNQLSKTLVAIRGELGDVLDALPVATGAFSRPLSFGSWVNIYLCNLSIGLGPEKINLGGANGPYSEVCR
ncbi:MlaD family protein [Aeromicrobium sp.]|uniref:MlaD family protein n=1 Tax=Aeromicrobium sp. TaxID=1871063 RepID=UPI0030BF482D